MFQHINGTENTKEKIGNKKNILSNVISKKYIIIYIVTFMVSMVNMGFGVSPFALAIIAASISNEIPIIAVTLLSIIGNAISLGISGTVTLIGILLLFFITFLIKEPRFNDASRNEKRLLSKRIFLSCLIINIIQVFINQFLIYDVLVSICLSIIVTIFYKIFTNSLNPILNSNEKVAFSLEEIIGASLLLSISLCCLQDLSIWGFSVRNVLSIFIVLVLGWKNGILVGTLAGVTIGITLGIIANNGASVIAGYAISGMIAGILNKYGKLGVIIGFLLGNVVLVYVANGLFSNVILFKEILIAGIALLAVPKNINLTIKDIGKDEKLLPVGVNRGLNKSKETIEKLNDVSMAVKDIADTYKDVAATVIDESDIKEKNKQIFIMELLNNIEYMKENILYENMQDIDSDIVNEIFEVLVNKSKINEKDLLKILAKYSSYLIENNDDENVVENDITQMTNAINNAFKIGKMSFVFSAKLKEEKQNFEQQLESVSKVISNIATEMNVDINSEELHVDKKEEITLLLKQKEILVQDISINKKENDRYNVNLSIEEIKKSNLNKIIIDILEKVLNEKLFIKEEKNVRNEKLIQYKIMSDDKFILDIGQSIAIKDGNSISGDSIIQEKLKDGKYLIAISDGMGSGAKARKSSQIVVSMLKRLLNSGFERDTSVDLINTSLLNISEEVFATLDIMIVDLYKGNVEFIKNGACPTYIKSNKKIQIIKSLTLPTGVIKGAQTDVFDKDIESGELIVMLSDGILDANVEFKNKELWIKYILEDIEILNPQKIADIILNEAIDNTFGKVKDDMSIIVCKFLKK